MEYRSDPGPVSKFVLAVVLAATCVVPASAQLIIDCNDNGIPDHVDLADGTSFDCNDDGVLDECETDCNGNLLHDDCDLASGASDDCDSSGVPDECETAPAFTAVAVGGSTHSWYAYFIAAGDITGDGDLDLAYTDGGAITWFENLDGVGGYGPVRSLPPGTSSRSITLADLDGDGDADLVGLYTPMVEWYEFDETLGNFLERVEISPFDSCHSDCCNDWTQPSTAADLDGDGDIDLVFQGVDLVECENALVWHENLDGEGTFSNQRIIEPVTITEFDHIRAIDLDGDRDLDLVSGGAGALRWYENDGAAGFTSRTLHSEPTRHVEVADFDGDGDPDVSAQTMDGTLVLLENADGRGSFAAASGALPALQGRLAAAADLDGDGDPDLVSNLNPDGSDTDDEFSYWYENSGSGFDTARLLMELGNPPSFLHQNTLFADLDLDGRLDLLFAFEQGPSWFRSLSADCNGNDVPDGCETDCNDNGIGDACDIRSGESVDCDANALPDECEVSCTDCNADSDLCLDELDCAPAVPGVWAESTPARGLSLGGGDTTWMTWNPPEAHGSTEVRYDLLRFAAPDGFPTAACVLADSTERSGEDSASPGPGELFFYLTRARSGCPGSDGTLAPSSDGTPRTAPPC